MSLLSFDVLPPWAMPISLAAHLAAGIVLGVLYFRVLRWNADLLAAGRPARVTIALMIGRFVVMGGLLTLASLEGALPLLLTALGVLLARLAVMRAVRQAAS